MNCKLHIILDHTSMKIFRARNSSSTSIRTSLRFREEKISEMLNKKQIEHIVIIIHVTDKSRNMPLTTKHIGLSCSGKCLNSLNLDC